MCALVRDLLLRQLLFDRMQSYMAESVLGHMVEHDSGDGMTLLVHMLGHHSLLLVLLTVWVLPIPCDCHVIFVCAWLGL